jgi:hypothetical protein
MKVLICFNCYLLLFHKANIMPYFKEINMFMPYDFRLIA